MSEEIVEVLRVIRYRGTRSDVESAVARSVHGTRHLEYATSRWVDITAQTLDEFPRVLDKKEKE